VLAAAGYPDTARSGDVITGADLPGVLHAGTRLRDDGAVVSAGGRVLSVLGTGATLDDARAAAYELIGRVDLPGGQYRTDIASRALAGDIAVPV
jgi:phosphoribosylamine--glycine ligase